MQQPRMVIRGIPRNACVLRFVKGTDVPATTPIRCGVIGVGRMGRHHARVYAQLPECELVGVVDQNPDRRTAIAEEWGGEPCESVAELIDRGVDAVTIATPTIHHR